MHSLENLHNGTQPTDHNEPSRCGFALTADDLEILRLILDHRFLRREQVSALTRRHPKRLHRRLSKLEHHGYLTTMRFPQQKYIYGIGPAGGQALVEHGRADAEVLEDRIRNHELKELFIKHEMMIVDIHVTLSLAASNGPIWLVDWREGSELYDSVFVPDHAGQVRIAVRPDAFFTLEDSRRSAGANRAHFFLEADRSTGSQKRFQEKLKTYWHYLEQGLHTRKYGIKNFRMLTITLTPERARNLCSLAARILPDRAKKYFLFGSTKVFSINDPAPILGDVFLCPRDRGEGRYPLIPSPTTSQITQPVL